MNSTGIDLDGESVNIAILDKNKNLIDVKNFDVKDINGSNNVNLFYIKNPKKNSITTGMDIQDVLIKNFPYEVKTFFSIKKIIKFQKKFITNIDSSKTINVPLIVKEFSIIKFFITTKELLKKHLNRLKHLNIDPDFITCSGMSLCRFATHFYNKTKDAFLVHLGQNKTLCVFMKNNIPEKTFYIKTGKKSFSSETLENKKNQTSVDVLSIKHSTNLYEKLTELKKEIKKTFIYFTNKKEDKYPLILTGNIENLINLDKFLENENTTMCLCSEKIKQNPKLNLFAISIGLALNLFSKDSKNVQFRKDGFTSNKKLIRIGKKILSFCFFVFFTINILYFISSSSIKTKEKLLHEHLINLKNFEKKELNKKNIISIKNLYDDLNDYEKILLKQTKDFPYSLKVPNVRQTLSWLNNDDLLQEAEIISFNYELQKYPNMLNRTDPYIAKIELEFKTKTPSIARNFYDLLIRGEGLANPKEEITWDVGHDCYKTSFYLKTLNTKI